MAAAPIVNEVRRGLYLDSVALMRMSRTVAAMPGVAECGIMMGTPANKRIMADAKVLAASGEAAGPGDLVIAVRAADPQTAHAALAAARSLLDKPRTASGSVAAWAPRTIRAAVAADPAANVALISVPGPFAAAEARKALQRGLNVMMFSDNVDITDEVALKHLARKRGLLMMGPDCGTAIINGTPLGFANVVPRGDIGIVGASGTGIQEVSCLIANNGGGISHAIGTGGRDLKADVGGITTLMAIDLLDADPATRHIIVISKPPAATVARMVLDRIARSQKSFTVCFIGGNGEGMPTNVVFAPTLTAAAQSVVPLATNHANLTPRRGKQRRGGFIRGLFAGGTLCAEAQVILREAARPLQSNTPIPSVDEITPGFAGDTLIDLGDDEFTKGRPHPMIEPTVRDDALNRVIADADTAVVLIDIVLGYGSHPDPAALPQVSAQFAWSDSSRCPCPVRPPRDS